MIVYTCLEENITEVQGISSCSDPVFLNVILVEDGETYVPDPMDYGLSFTSAFAVVGSFYIIGMSIRALIRQVR